MKALSIIGIIMSLGGMLTSFYIMSEARCHCYCNDEYYLGSGNIPDEAMGGSIVFLLISIFFLIFSIVSAAISFSKKNNQPVKPLAPIPPFPQTQPFPNYQQQYNPYPQQNPYQNPYGNPYPPQNPYQQKQPYQNPNPYTPNQNPPTTPPPPNNDGDDRNNPWAPKG